MFKKILTAIQEVRSDMRIYNREFNKEFVEARIDKKTLDDLVGSLNYQSRLYEQTLSEKYEDDNNKYEAVILVPYRGKPLVYKDGKKVSTDTMSSFDVGWSFDSKTEVTIRND